MKSTCYTILGLISGSSLDGLDITLCDFSDDPKQNMKWSLTKASTVEFGGDLKIRLREATHLSSRDLMKLEVQFSKFCAQCVTDFIRGSDIKIDYIASHGHTVFHYPRDGYTLQIGKGSIIAEETGIPCISDFRANDIALGGEGAPVAPIVEQYLYPGYDVYFNLGGIANFSIHSEDVIRSIDSCPCNQVLNHLIQERDLPYDDKGIIASRGVVSEVLIKAWSDLPYFGLPSPKSMDNSWVHETFIPVMKDYELTVEDRLASMVEFCAIQLTKDIRHLIGLTGRTTLRGWATGGGAFNDYLIDRMRYHFDKIGLSLDLPDEDTINYKEGILMALMGYLRVNHVSNTLPSVTGATKASIGGAVYLPAP